MKLGQGILLAVLLAVVPILSACGPSAAERAQQEHYRRTLEAYKEQAEAYQEQQETYRKELAESLAKYLQEYQEYQQKLQQQQLQELQERSAEQ